MVDDGAHALAAHLEDAAGALLGLDHLRALVQLLHHGLLAVDVLAGVHGVDGDLRVPVVGGADDHGVDVLARQHFAVIARGEEVIAPDFLGAGQAAVVDIGDGHQFYAADV